MGDAYSVAFYGNPFLAGAQPVCESGRGCIAIVEVGYGERKVVVIIERNLLCIADVAFQNVPSLHIWRNLCGAYKEIGEDDSVRSDTLKGFGWDDAHHLAIGSREHHSIVYAKEGVFVKARVAQSVV